MKFTITNETIITSLYPKVKDGTATEQEIKKLTFAMTREVMRKLKGQRRPVSKR